MIPLRDKGYNRTKSWAKTYTKNEIDYFIGIDIESDDVYVLPIERIDGYKRSISCNVVADCKNNFELFN